MRTPGLGREVEVAAVALGRRDVLRLAMVASAGGLLPVGCGGLPPELAPRGDDPLVVLTPRTHAVLTAATMRIVGPTGAALVRSGAVDPGRTADRWLAGTPAVASTMQAALWALEIGVPPIVWKLRPFTRLGPGAQDAVLGDMMRSSWDLPRRIFGGVRALGLLAFYGSPESREVTGYPGPFGDDDVSIGDAMAAPDAEW